MSNKQQAAQLGYKGHRKGTKAAAAHRLFDALRKQRVPRSVIVAQFRKKARLTEYSAAHYYRAFNTKKH